MKNKESVKENVKATIKNRDLRTVELKLDSAQTFHTNPDGKKIKIKKVGDEYFSKRSKCSKPRGMSWAFPNHLEYNGWLALNGFVQVDVEELEG